MTITNRNPIRNLIADLPTYWSKPGQEITRIAELLAEHQLQIVGTVSFNDAAAFASYTYSLADVAGADVENSVLVFSWYRLPSGRYEITAYLS